MATSSGSATVAATIALLVGIWAIAAPARRRRLPLPPGPPAKSWFSGNAADIPRVYVWLKFTEWARKYGDIIHIRIRSNNIIVLSSYDAIVDLFEKRGSIYSHRPRRMMALMMGWGNVTTFSEGERWKAYRRQANLGFSKRAAVDYQDGQTKDVYAFLQRLLENPEDIAKELNMLTATIIMRITYGYQVTEANDPYITASDDAVASLTSSSVPGNYLVDTYPFLRHFPTWLPGMGFKVEAQKWNQLPLRMVEGPYQWALKQINDGKASPSFLSELLEQNEDGEEGEDLIKWAVGSMYNAGSHTTVSTLLNFILAMILYPQAARKAREEIDRVVGTDRLPVMSDRPNLPYLECVLLETFRWYPVAPLTLPHRVIQEDEYRGYRIPANSTVYPNIYAITRDERIFPDPEVFIPERFDGIQPGPAPLDPRELVFGIGRRVCPGSSIAEATMYLVMANLIATMDITKARDKNGKEIEPEVVRTGGLVSATKSFKCSIKPRSEQAARLINSSTLLDHE